MSEPRSIAGRRILVIEDDYLIALDLTDALEERGAEVIGPAGNIGQATRLAQTAEQIDGALLDINLRGEMSYPIADVLRARGVRFVFTTGYDKSNIPDRYRDIGCCEKPLQIDTFIKMLFG